MCILTTDSVPSHTYGNVRASASCRAYCDGTLSPSTSNKKQLLIGTWLLESWMLFIYCIHQLNSHVGMRLLTANKEKCLSYLKYLYCSLKCVYFLSNSVYVININSIVLLYYCFLLVSFGHICISDFLLFYFLGKHFRYWVCFLVFLFWKKKSFF